MSEDAEFRTPDNELDLFASAGDGLHPDHFGIDEHGRAYVQAPPFAKALDYRDASNALRILDEDDKGTQIVSTPGGDQRALVIYEDGIWELIFLSRKPSAKAIKARVKAILRQLRETGVVDMRPLDDPLDELEAETQRTVRAIALAREQRARAELAEAKVAQLEPLAEGYRHFLESDGTVKWANACEHLGVGSNLFGAYLRDRRILVTDEYWVTRDGRQEKRQGERHNRPYADYRTWFAFVHYEESERLAGVPEHRRYDRRVTKAGMDGLLRVLKRHVVECGRCSLCESVRTAKPTIYAEWRPVRSQIGA